MATMVHEVLGETAKRYGDRPALRVKRDGGWRTTSWSGYLRDVRRAGRALVGLGVQPGKGVSIIGYNCPEWLIADVGAIFAGAVPAGIYTTNTPEQVRYITDHCEAKVAFAENAQQVDKFVAEQERMPRLEVVVQMLGRPTEAKRGRLRVMAWEDFLKLGDETPESELEARLKAQKPDDVCTLIYTSGTTGDPKAVMISHTNLVWTAKAATTAVTAGPDDVMVSYAEPGGNVGPHVDSYDVFLVQGQGERRWRWHTRPTKEKRLVPDLELRVLSRFRPDADEVLGPGDMLYLPPGFAHHGVAVTPCLTYSIGFRSPSAGEMWTSFAASAKERPEASRLLEDPELSASAHPGAIPKALLARVREMVRAMDVSDAAIDRWFASFATRLKPGHVLEPPRRAPDSKTILARLSRGDTVARSEEGRWAFLPRPRGALLLYVGGEEIEVPVAAAELARTICAARRHDGHLLQAEAKSAAARALLLRLFAMGALAFTRR